MVSIWLLKMGTSSFDIHGLFHLYTWIYEGINRIWWSTNDSLTIICIIIPHHRGGHTVLSADPVGVGVLVSVASCLHSISLMNGWNLAKLTQINHLPFSRSHKDLDCWKRLENCLSAHYLLKEQMDFDHTCTSRLLEHEKELIRFWWPWPHFQSHDGLDGWKMACLHPISWMNGWIFTKLVHLCCWDMEKNWLDFGDLDPIFKVTGGLRLFENGKSAPYLQNKWMDFD